ncbi:hypothetical protein QAD02_010940 [Eretmocerus hayati]|uniref:Uncharacterized protein n=1 Tax=Eretmocerus hayati TaxID=131215 RepID=A0ACC2NXX6_9HYME|nr:hypothetical protein QAD02_010940 [Eretmocerus hayati]
MMTELENGGNYKFYKCRGLTRDSGGTVCDTSERYDDCSNGRLSSHYNDESSQNDLNQFEPIVYFFSSENEFDRKKESLVDSTTHLDDDEFNDYDTSSNSSQAPETEVLRYFPDQKDSICTPSYDQSYVEDENFEPYSFSSTEVDQSSDNDFIKTGVNGDFDSYCQPDESTDDYHTQSTNQMENSYHYSSDEDNLVIDDENCSPSVVETEPYTSDNKGDDHKMNRTQDEVSPNFESNKTHLKSCHKRKQTYLIKDDSFAESPKKGYSSVGVYPFFLENGKETSHIKKRFKTNPRGEPDIPFPNVKMNSILKGNIGQAPKDVTCQHIQNIENFSPLKIKQSSPLCHSSPTSELPSLSACPSIDHGSSSVVRNNFDQNYQINDGNSEYRTFPREGFKVKNGYPSYNYSFYNGQISVHGQKFPQYQSVSSIIRSKYVHGFGVVTGYPEFEDDNYFTYVQPREIIVESDMDKLVSPTVDIDTNTFSKTFPTHQSFEEKRIDFNGNELKDVNNELNRPNSELSAKEIVEKEIRLRSAHAVQLGLENYFKTSNDSVIDEILYGEVFLETRLELDVDKRSEDGISGGSTKISCSILESLNDLQHFGGSAKESMGHRNVSSSNSHEALSYKYQGHPQRFLSNLSFNFSNKSHSLGVDQQPKKTAVEENGALCGQSTALKMKIKKENDEYRVDELKAESIKIYQKDEILEPIKTVDGYQCYYCPEKLRTKKLLRKHVSDHHRGKCKKSSTVKGESCPRSAIYPCDKCDKVYSYQASLRKHLLKHHHLIF